MWQAPLRAVPLFHGESQERKKMKQGQEPNIQSNLGFAGDFSFMGLTKTPFWGRCLYFSWLLWKANAQVVQGATLAPWPRHQNSHLPAREADSTCTSKHLLNSERKSKKTKKPETPSRPLPLRWKLRSFASLRFGYCRLSRHPGSWSFHGPSRSRPRSRSRRQ